MTVIEGADLEARQLHSVADALRSVPGLALVSTGGLGATTGLFPRGGESNYTLVVIDGVPANAFGGDFDFGQLATANIDRIEVVRGPQSALFGANAIGSVVRIVSRRGGQPSGLFQVEAGQLRHVSRGRLDRRQLRRPGMGRLLRSAADRRHERREHGRRRDRRQRRLHATIVRGIARVAQQRVVAARRRAARRRRARLSRSVRQQPGRQLQRDRSGVAWREFANAGGRRLVVAVLRARPAAGTGELQRNRRRLRQPVRRVAKLLAPRDGPLPVGFHHSRGIGSLGGHGAPA